MKETTSASQRSGSGSGRSDSSGDGARAGSGSSWHSVFAANAEEENGSDSENMDELPPPLDDDEEPEVKNFSRAEAVAQVEERVRAEVAEAMEERLKAAEVSTAQAVAQARKRARNQALEEAWKKIRAAERKAKQAIAEAEERARTDVAAEAEKLMRASAETREQAVAKAERKARAEAKAEIQRRVQEQEEEIAREVAKAEERVRKEMEGNSSKKREALEERKIQAIADAEDRVRAEAVERELEVSSSEESEMAAAVAEAETRVRAEVAEEFDRRREEYEEELARAVEEAEERARAAAEAEIEERIRGEQEDRETAIAEAEERIRAEVAAETEKLLQADDLTLAEAVAEAEKAARDEAMEEVRDRIRAKERHRKNAIAAARERARAEVIEESEEELRQLEEDIAEEAAEAEARAKKEALAEVEEQMRSWRETRTRTVAEAEERVRAEMEEEMEKLAEAEEEDREKAVAEAEERARAEVLDAVRERRLAAEEERKKAVTEAEERIRAKVLEEAGRVFQADSQTTEEAVAEAERRAREEALAEAQENARAEEKERIRAIMEAEERVRAEVFAEAEEAEKAAQAARKREIAEAKRRAREKAEAEVSRQVRAGESSLAKEIAEVQARVRAEVMGDADEPAASASEGSVGETEPPGDESKPPADKRREASSEMAAPSSEEVGSDSGGATAPIAMDDSEEGIGLGESLGFASENSGEQVSEVERINRRGGLLSLFGSRRAHRKDGALPSDPEETPPVNGPGPEKENHRVVTRESVEDDLPEAEDTENPGEVGDPGEAGSMEKGEDSGGVGRPGEIEGVEDAEKAGVTDEIEDAKDEERAEDAKEVVDRGSQPVGRKRSRKGVAAKWLVCLLFFGVLVAGGAANSDHLADLAPTLRERIPALPDLDVGALRQRLPFLRGESDREAVAGALAGLEAAGLHPDAGSWVRDGSRGFLLRNVTCYRDAAKSDLLLRAEEVRLGSGPVEEGLALTGGDLSFFESGNRLVTFTECRGEIRGDAGALALSGFEGRVGGLQVRAGRSFSLSPQEMPAAQEALEPGSSAFGGPESDSFVPWLALLGKWAPELMALERGEKEGPALVWGRPEGDGQEDLRLVRLNGEDFRWKGIPFHGLQASLALDPERARVAVGDFRLGHGEGWIEGRFDVDLEGEILDIGEMSSTVDLAGLVGVLDRPRVGERSRLPGMSGLKWRGTPTLRMGGRLPYGPGADGVSLAIDCEHEEGFVFVQDDRRVPVRNLLGEFQLTDRGLRFTEFSAKLFAGSAQVEGEYRADDPSAPFEGTFQTTGMDLGQLGRYWGMGERGFTGKLSLRFAGAGFRESMRIRGDGSFHVENANLATFPAVGEVGKLLAEENPEFRFGEAGDMTGRYDLELGVLVVEDFTLRGERSTLMLDGSYNLANQAVDFRAKVFREEPGRHAVGEGASGVVVIRGGGTLAEPMLTVIDQPGDGTGGALRARPVVVDGVATSR